MKNYLYPKNLKSKTKILKWQARDFIVIVYRFRNQSKDLVGTIVSRLEKCMSEYDFVCKRLEKSDLKQFLAVYFGISSYGAEIADVEGATNENM